MLTSWYRVSSQSDSREMLHSLRAGTSKLHPDLQLGKETGMKQQNFQESHHLSQLLFGETDSEGSFDFYFFSMLVNCPLGHQELNKAERSWLISS